MGEQKMGLEPARKVAKDLGISYQTIWRRGKAGQFTLYTGPRRVVYVDPERVREALQPKPQRPSQPLI